MDAVECDGQRPDSSSLYCMAYSKPVVMTTHLNLGAGIGKAASVLGTTTGVRVQTIGFK